MDRDLSANTVLVHEPTYDTTEPDARWVKQRETDTDYQSYMRRLVPVARSILGCDDQACDAVQEAFVALWKEPVFPPNPWAWLVRAVVFRSRHARRCRLRRRRHEDRAAELRPGSISLSPARDLENAELRRELEEAIAALPDEFRDAFVLREIDGLDYETIAATTAVPIGTVRSRIHRARTRLQELLEPKLSA